MTSLRVVPRERRITEIAEELVTGMVDQGLLDPNNETAMEAACCQAVLDAAALYDAAIEYISLVVWRFPRWRLNA